MEAQQFTPLLIRASAGTGKTFQLTNRLLTLLAAGETPAKVLATTFTRKAAGEIMSRIFTRLAAAAQNEEAATRLATDLKLPHLTLEDFRSMLRRVASAQHLLNICTIDSFFIKIATVFCSELGLPEDWALIEEVEETELQERAVNRMLADGKPGELRTLVQLLARGRSGRKVHEALRRIVAAGHSLYLETSEDEEAWLVPQSFEPLSDKEVEALLKEIRELPVPLTKNQTPHKSWENAKTTCLTLAARGRWREILKTGLCSALLQEKESFSRVPIDDAHRELYGRLNQHIAGLLSRTLRQQTWAARVTLEHFHRYYAEEQHARGRFRFLDITRLLASPDCSERFHEIYYRLDSRVSHLLLDEFQDTAVVQWKVLEPIADEIIAAYGPERSLFCVGDIKQAIYAWRGGEAAIFDSLQQRYEQLKVTVMHESRRSSAEVLSLVNHVFSTLPDNPALAEYKEVAARWTGNYVEHEAVYKDLPGYAAVFGVPYDGRYYEARPAVCAKAVALIADIYTTRPSATIGVLVRANSAIPELIQALRQAGVAASEEGGVSLFDAESVGVLAAFLQCADHPGDTLARFHVASSLLGSLLGFTDHREHSRAVELAREVRRRLLAEGYGKTLYHYASLLSPHCNAREQRRLQQLVDEAYRFDELSAGRPAQFLRYLKQVRVEDPASERVRVMTIHQSKGLEFDAVVLPNLEGDLCTVRDSLLAYRPNPLAPPEQVFANVGSELRSFDPELGEIFHAIEAERVKEALNVLYVALTRAKHGLYAVVPVKNESFPKTYAGVLLGALQQGSAIGARGGEEASAATDTGADPAVLLYEDGTRAWGIGDAVDAAPTGEEDVIDAVPRFGTGGRRTRNLSRVAPSSLEGSGHSITLADILRPPASAAKLRGQAIHALFEQIEWLEDGQCERETLERVIAGLPNPPRNPEEIITQFLESLTYEEVRRLLSRQSYEKYDRVRVERELPFAVRDGDSIMRGIIDRLHLQYSGEKLVGAEVIDFKADQMNEEMVAEKIRFYTPQLAAYRTVTARLFNLPEERVTLRLALVSIGKVCTITLPTETAAAA